MTAWRERWEWPPPSGRRCGAVAIDRAMGRTVSCLLRPGHSSHEHHWEELVGDVLESATWHGGAVLPTFIGEQP